MTNFNDPEYDGIVLRIPSWFIPMNEIEPAIENLQQALENCKKSMYLPEHKRNLYELENYGEKKSIADAIEEKRKDEAEVRKSRYDKLISKEIYQLEWVKDECTFEDAYEKNIELPGGNCYSSKEIFTKSGVQTSFEKEFRSRVKTYEDLQELSNLNSFNVGLRVTLENAAEEFIDMDYNLYRSKNGWGDILGISLRRLYVCRDWRKVKNNYKYKLARLGKFGDQYGITQGNGSELFSGFYKHNMQLIKS